MKGTQADELSNFATRMQFGPENYPPMEDRAKYHHDWHGHRVSSLAHILLLGLEVSNVRLTTRELAEGAKSFHEDWRASGWDPGFIGWDRGNVRACLYRLQKRGLVAYQAGVWRLSV